MIQNIESNPIFIDGKIISVTADWKIVAHEVENGNLVWGLQSLICLEEGVWCHLKIKQIKNYIFAPIGGKVYKIDALTGKIEKGFGNKGFIESFTLVNHYLQKLLYLQTQSL